MNVRDWEVVRRLLPEGWELQARTLGAMRRGRGLRNAESLLRALLAHVADGCSLVETACRVRQAGWGRISSVALFKRLRASEQWLRWMARGMWAGEGIAATGFSGRVLASDGTIVRESGPTGGLWRVHWTINLDDLQCESFELTDVRGGESFRRAQIQRGDLLLGDRCYGTPPGVADVVGRGGDVLVRVNPNALPLYEKPGRRMKLRHRLRQLQVGDIISWRAWVKGPQGNWIKGRLVAIRRSAASTRQVRKRLRRRANRKQEKLRPDTIELARYLLIWTSLPEKKAAPATVLRLYRLRWQIELAFKRMKSIMGLGQLPKKSDASSRAYLHGKLLVVLLLERIWREAEAFSPWGYPLEESAESLARDQVSAS